MYRAGSNFCHFFPRSVRRSDAGYSIEKSIYNSACTGLPLLPPRDGRRSKSPRKISQQSEERLTVINQLSLSTNFQRTFALQKDKFCNVSNYYFFGISIDRNVGSFCRTCILIDMQSNESENRGNPRIPQ